MDLVLPKLNNYFAIYNQIWANPLISISEIAQKTNMEMNTVSQYLAEMNRKFMGGPVICMNPAENYHHYTYFLRADDPLSVYREFGKPPVLSRWLGVGSWNMLLISEKCIDISQLGGLEILHGLKSRTQFSKVSTANWDQSLRKMYSAIDTPEEKSYLYEEGPAIPWKEWEWILYHKLRNNVRIPVNSILEKMEIHHTQYKKWVHSLPAYAHIQVSFYPSGWENYFVSDFLFKSEYQKQLTEVLGMLPSTAFFFSLDNYVLARLSVTTRREKNELLTFICEMGEKGYFTNFYQALPIFAVHNLSIIEWNKD